jgi:hypothetical protein
MHSEGEYASNRILLEGSGALMERYLGEKTFDRRRRNDAGRNLGSMETVDWNVSKRVGCRNTKNAVTNRDVVVPICRDEMHVTGSVDNKGTVREDMGLLVSGRSLGTIIEMCSKAIVIIMTNLVDGIFA